MNIFWTGLLILALTACSVKEKEVSIFAVPTTATPSELEENGFRICRDLNFSGEVDRDHRGEILFCDLELGYASAHARYPEHDTSRFRKYVIFIDCKPFEKMTGFKATNYTSLEIDGYPYEVKLTPNNMSLEMKRLGL